jgi:hypothetical protein
VGPYNLVYEEHVGDYGKTGDIMMRVHDSIEKDFKIKPDKAFGLYYDDPGKVSKDKLRSDIGCIIDDKDAGALNAIKTKFKIKKYKKINSIVAEFPFRNMFSIFIGMYRVYPRLDKYIKDKGYKMDYAFEVYDKPGKKILYTFPIRK